ncbi:hypothetical protein BH24ACT5_BH24ACT5_24890 [soil metagenome]
MLEHRDEYDWEREAMRSIAAKLGIGTTETLRKCVRKAEVDVGARPRVTTAEQTRIRDLERRTWSCVAPTRPLPARLRSVTRA